MKSQKLNYVFRRHVMSCSGNGEWICRGYVLQSNECKSNPWQLAGNIASHYMRVDEQGVKVEFLGLQEDKKPDAPITPLGNFTLTLVRNGSTPAQPPESEKPKSPVVVRVCKCVNGHVYRWPVRFSGDLQIEPSEKPCPQCGKGDSFTSPWRLLVGDSLFDLPFRHEWKTDEEALYQ